MKYLLATFLLCLLACQILSEKKYHLKITNTTALPATKINTNSTTNSSAVHNQTANNNTDEEDPSLEPKEYKGNCFIKIKNRMYDLSMLSADCRNYYVTGKGGNQIFDFSFCGNIRTNCNGTMGLFVNKEKCIRYANDSSNDKLFQEVEEAPKRVTDKSQGRSRGKVLRISLPPGDVCATTKGVEERYQTVFEVECDPREPYIKIDNNGNFDPHVCKNVIKIRSQAGCVADYYKPWYNQFGVDKQLVAILLIIVGLELLIFGEKLIKFNIILIMGACLGVIFYSIANNWFKVDLLTSLGIGFGAVGILVCAVFDFLATSVGAIVGYFIGNIVYNFEVTLIQGIDPNILYWSTIIAFIVLATWIAAWIQKMIFIIATALMGAYALVRGSSIYMKGYPDETYVMQLIKHKEFNQLEKLLGGNIYGYLGAMFVISIVGMIVQCGLRSDDEEKKEAPVEAQKEGEVQKL